ncbi:MAG: porin [Verrucomicrobiota bacterium]
MNKLQLTSTIALAGLCLTGAAYAQETPSVEEMWKIIQEQQAQIADLQTQLEVAQQDAAETQSQVQLTQTELIETQEQLDMTVSAVEDGLIGGEGSGETGWFQNTSLGGYGELHANFFPKASNEIDFHRFVLFVNHEFTENIRLFSEIELEHALAGDGKPGEVELEQAFIQFDVTDQLAANVGLYLLPVVGLNEYHEPTTFYGVERNGVDVRIIPTTWWEGGVMGTYRFDNGVAVDASVSSGLNINPLVGNIRSGRQKVAEAVLNDAAYTARVRYTGIPGLDLGASLYYQNDMAQTSSAKVSGLLSAFYGQYTWENITLKAQYARWDLWGSALPESAKEQWGTYIEPSYIFDLDSFGELGIFYRFSYYEYQKNALTFSKNTINQVGFNYWPIPDVVLKADVEEVSGADDFVAKGDYAVNLGIGFVF